MKAVCILTLTLVLAVTTHLRAALPAAKTQQLTSPDQVPVGLAKSDWSSIREAYEAGRHTIQAVASGWQARNPGQQWLTNFDGRGFVTEPAGGGWQWGLELQSYGFTGNERVIGGVPAVRTEGQRLTYTWDTAVEEWFVNDARGLEHGFTVHTRPEGNSSLNDEASTLNFLLTVRGGLRPAITTDGQGVEFLDASGAAVLHYAGLKVWDADGKALASRFEVAGENRFRLLVDERTARYPITIDPIAQQTYLKASNTETADNFGISVAVSGDTVVVGAYAEDSGATGVGGNQADNSALYSGAAYVFIRSGTTWTQQAYLKASNTGAGDSFGYSVAASGDTVVVGAYQEASNATGVDGNQANNSLGGSGAAYVFTRSGTAWAQQAYLKASNSGASDQFGFRVAASGDTVVVGAYAEDSNANGVGGNQASNSAIDSGAAYVFTRSGTTWTQQTYLKASNTEEGDQFAFSVAASGDTVVVGARLEDSNATGVGGNQANNSATSAGAAYVFTRSGTTWTQQAYLKASNTEAGDQFDGFGQSVAVSGDTVVVGASAEDSNATGVNGNQADNSAPYSGAAYIFIRSGTTWSQEAYLKASNTGADDFFGQSVAVSGDTVVVGAFAESSNATGVDGDQFDNSTTNAGAAYIFVRNGTIWTQQAYLKASNTSQGYQFGHSVAVSNDTVVVGAHGESNSATGVNPAHAGLASGAGAAYIFGLGPAPAITVEVSGVNIADGGTKSFGEVDVEVISDIAFTIRNTGDTDLTDLVVSKDGTNSGDFTVRALSSTSVPVGAGTAAFTVSFMPSASGSRSAAIHIASNVIGATNPFDITLTGTGTVAVPMINAHPGSISVTQGQQAMFEVTATGWGLSYQWKKGGDPINGATAATYSIPATLAADAGSYTVVVSNEGGSTTSDPAVLTVYVPPGFTQMPPHTTVSQGQPISLTPSIEGTGTLMWQWRKDGVNIPGATSPSYGIASAQPWHSGNYSAVISNGTDSATSADAAVKVSPFSFNVWQGLVAYYPLNAAQPGNDYGPTAQHATNQGTSAAADSWGRSDAARRFVASESDGMMTASGAFFHSQPSFTWTAWVKTSGTYGSASTRIFSTEGPDGSGQAGFGLYANSNGKIGAGLNWGGGGQGFESAAVYPANVWRHLAATYDGSRLRLYVDGAQAGSRLYSGVTLTSDSPLYFGKYRTNADGSTGGYFDGWLDDLRFYNRVLSAADLTQLRASDDGMDLDNDSLGDAWEARYGFSAAADESSGDADGDGMTNRDEYLAGSSPVSAASNFHAPQLNEVPGLNVLNLTWTGSPARNYAVQTSADLMTWATIATMPGLTGPTSLVVEAPLRPVRHYYKVVVVP